MVQSPRMIGVPWFRRDSYPRIQSLPGSDLKDSYEQWQERAERMFNVMHSAGQKLTRVVLEPDELKRFAQEIGADAITANVRAELANRKLEEMHQVDDPAPCDLFCIRCGSQYSYPQELLRVVEGLQITCECGGRLRRPPPAMQKPAV
ncbi:MAG: hypothetical protein JSR25_15935 [Proteobacteria bacterium]|nr:hypothetical protein [Pseudomonadota bacterium]